MPDNNNWEDFDLNDLDEVEFDDFFDDDGADFDTDDANASSDADFSLDFDWDAWMAEFEEWQENFYDEWENNVQDIIDNWFDNMDEDTRWKLCRAGDMPYDEISDILNEMQNDFDEQMQDFLNSLDDLQQEYDAAVEDIINSNLGDLNIGKNKSNLKSSENKVDYGSAQNFLQINDYLLRAYDIYETSTNKPNELLAKIF